MVIDHGNTDHDGQVVLVHIVILRERWDAEQGLVLPGALPVGHDLLVPEAGPFPDELERPGLQAASKYVPVCRDGGAPPCMVGMEVGHRVIALVPVHVDHNTVEGADTRHDTTIALSAVMLLPARRGLLPAMIRFRPGSVRTDSADTSSICPTPRTRTGTARTTARAFPARSVWSAPTAEVAEAVYV